MPLPLTARVRGFLQRRKAEREIDDELAFHVAQETEANIARGMAPADARLAALRAFGGIAQAREAVREVRTLPVESVGQDVRRAARTLASHPRFTLATAGLLALAVGFTTAMFTIVDALMIRPVPFRDADRLAHLMMATDRGGRTVVAPDVMRAWRASPAFEAAESATSDAGLIEAGGTIVDRQVATVTPGVFEMLGDVRPLYGRLFHAGEGSPGQADRLLLSETVWRALYNADPALVGRSITLDGQRFTVVGILPASFRFPSAATAVWRPTDLRGKGEMALAYVRFARGVPREDALRLATSAARAADAANAQLTARVYPLAGVQAGQDRYSRPAIRLLAGGVVLVFLVLCANVCSLLLGRLAARRREFSVRAALGASRGRLMQQAIVETIGLGALGVAIGAGVAALLVSIARALLPEPLLLQTLNPLDLDTRALVATSVCGLLATMIAGLVPAWLGTRVDAGDSPCFTDRSRMETRGARALSRGLLIAEVAFASALLVAAVLLTRSFVNLARADRGLETSNVTTLWLSLTAASDAEARQLLVRTLDDELRRLPGVRQVAWSYGLPPRGGMISWGKWISDVPGERAVDMTVDRYVVSPAFFSLYRIPIVRGRGFGASDTFATVIVSERFARALWPDVDPIGRTFRFEQEQFQVIGIARETYYPAVDSTLDGPEFYHPYVTAASTPMVSLRCVPECADAAVIRHRIASTVPTVRVQDAGALESHYAAQLSRPRATAALAVVFASIAVVAAAGGLFGVLSYAVNRRRREFGVRAALGALPGHLRRVVLRDALIVATSGLSSGSIVATALARSLAALEYGVTPGDPLSWSLVVGLIAVTTAVAAWGPARAAAAMDPLTLLREE